MEVIAQGSKVWSWQTVTEGVGRVTGTGAHIVCIGVACKQYSRERSVLGAFEPSVTDVVAPVSGRTVPGTFTSLQKSDTIHNGLADNEAGEWILNTIQNPPLLATACVLFVSGLAIMSWLFWEYRGNYIWLTNRIFV
ncbi:Pc12g04060 [Penicillium rubens Wisconsin 54-1255]|uniref:Pc12g04060 protein n=1 Tax=Penicillium rubens (strain ATCC 28089 / DSM 1075 / NRRL 1951 / Wisconsin 54-1255) TaxID=500485 RepID=B6GXB2_PENRW|nr:Pc12g04060 [Penicillium rubens Wisconsin 54-1255]